jgi:hypothetical protein
MIQHGPGHYSHDVAEQPKLWIARLIVSPRTAEKLSSKHNLDQQEVVDAVVCVKNLAYTWNVDPERGLRALVEVEIRGKRCLVVIYPVDDPSGDVYALGSAYPR